MAKSATTTALTNTSLAVEIESGAALITDALYHHNTSQLLQAVIDVVNARCVRAFDAHVFAAGLLACFADVELQRDLRQSAGSGRQYVLTRFENSTVTGNSVAVFPTAIQDRIPAEIIADLDRLKLRFDIAPERMALKAMFDEPRQSVPK